MRTKVKFTNGATTVLPLAFHGAVARFRAKEGHSIIDCENSSNKHVFFNGSKVATIFYN